MEIKKCIMTNSTCYKKAGVSAKTGIVMHSTGCKNPYISRYVQPLETDPNYKEIIDDIGVNHYGNDWNHKDRYAGVHAFIGKNAKGKVEVYQVLPYEKDAWGVGKGTMMPAGTKYYLDVQLKKPVDKLKKQTKTNVINGYDKATYFSVAGNKYYCPASAGLSYNFSPNARVQFEICEDDQTDEKYFSDAFDAAAKYCAYLCKLNGWDSNQVCSHAESYKDGYGCDHDDPDSWMKKFGKDMNWFRKQVQVEIDKDDKYDYYLSILVGIGIINSTDDFKDKIKADRQLYLLIKNVAEKYESVYFKVGKVVEEYEKTRK